MGIRDIFRRKRKGPVIDLRDLQKREIIEIPAESEEENDESSDNPDGVSAGQFDFFGAIASSSSESSEDSSMISDSDLKYRVDKLYQKLSNLLDRIELIEKKIKRLEDEKDRAKYYDMTENE